MQLGSWSCPQLQGLCLSHITLSPSASSGINGSNGSNGCSTSNPEGLRWDGFTALTSLSLQYCCIDSLDIAVAGPLARSAQDLQLAMQVLTTPLQQFGPLGWTAAQWRRNAKPLRECRVAIVFDDPEARVDRSIQDRLHALADFLRAQGVTVLDDHRPVDSAQSHRVYSYLLRAATGAWLDDATFARFHARGQQADPALDTMRERVWRGSTLTHRDWVEFDQQRAVLRTQWQSYFESVDLLITPVATSPAFLHNQQG